MAVPVIRLHCGPDLGHPRRNINLLFNSETFNCSRGPASKNGHTWARPARGERNQEMEWNKFMKIPPSIKHMLNATLKLLT